MRRPRRAIGTALPRSLRSPSGALPGGGASGGDGQRHGSRRRDVVLQARSLRRPDTTHRRTMSREPAPVHAEPAHATTERPSSRQSHHRASRTGGVAPGRGGPGRHGGADRAWPRRGRVTPTPARRCPIDLRKESPLVAMRKILEEEKRTGTARLRQDTTSADADDHDARPAARSGGSGSPLRHLRPLRHGALLR